MSAENVELWEDRSNCHLRLGQYKKAERCFDEILKRNPIQVEALDWKGIIVAQEGHLRDAISFFDRALEIEPDNTRILTNKALALEQLGDSDAAKECYKKTDIP
jgi:tetratricopeptide (TPR) repeat protein